MKNTAAVVPGNRTTTAPSFIDLSGAAALGDGDGEVEGVGEDGHWTINRAGLSAQNALSKRA
jgi:hypothetical protein